MAIRIYSAVGVFGCAFVSVFTMCFGSGGETVSQWKRFELDNGLVFFTQEDHTTSVVSHHIFVQVGSRLESPGITDISHLIEHLRWGGNPGEEPFEKRLQSLGGSTGGHTFPDFTDYVDSGPGPALEMMIESGSQFLSGLRTQEDRFLTERDVLLSEDLLANQHPDYVALRHLFSVAFQAHPYKNPAGGWRSDLSQITLQDVQAFFKTFYIPGNSAVFLAGDFETQRAVLLMKKYYGALPRGPAVPRTRTVEPPQNAEKRVRFFAAVSRPTVWVGYHVPGLGHRDVPALQILHSLLCNGRSAWLEKELVERQKIASAINPYGIENQQWRKDPSLWVIGMTIGPGVLERDGERRLAQEIENMRSFPISDAVLKRAVMREITDRSTYILYPEWQLWFVTSRTEQAGFYYSLTGDPDYASKLIEAYKAITVDDIRFVADRYLNASNRSVVVMMPKMTSPASEEKDK
jgi:zinc protease